MELLTMRDLITWVRVTRLYMRRGECGAQTVRARQPFTTQEAKKTTVAMLALLCAAASAQQIQIPTENSGSYLDPRMGEPVDPCAPCAAKKRTKVIVASAPAASASATATVIVQQAAAISPPAAPIRVVEEKKPVPQCVRWRQNTETRVLKPGQCNPARICLEWSTKR